VKTNDGNPQKPRIHSASQNAPTDEGPDFRTLVANVPGIVYRVHLKEQYRMKFFNDMLEPMTGYKACELKTGGVCSIDPLILSEDRVIVLNVVKSAVEENKPFEVEYRLRHKNGSIRHFLERGRPVPGSEGEPAFIDGVILDITTRKHMEEALRESEERFRSVLENSLDAAYRRNLKTDRYDYVSSVFEQIIGLTPDELRDVSTEEALQRVHPDDRQQVAQELERNLRGGKQLLEYRFKGKDGEYKWLADTISVFSDRDGHLSYRVGVARDVTARKQVEAALKESQTRLLQITENINEVFWLINPDWTELLYVSPGYERVWGKPCESLYSQPLSWLEAVLEEDRPAILAKLEEGFCDQETMTLPEYRIVRPDGTQRCIQDRAWPIRGERGNIQRLAGIAEDITDRKRAEEALQRAHDELELRVKERTGELEAANRALGEYAAKLERLNKELQDFAFVASHDLQEPLRKIRMIAADSTGALSEKGRDFLGRMQKAAERMQVLLMSLLDYSRVTTRGAPFKETDLNKSVEGALSYLEILIQEKKGKVEVEELPSLQADPTQMIRLFQNLIANAVKFQGNNRPPRIRIYSRPVGEGKEVDVYRTFVEDNGIGFDEKYLDKVFAPFQRLHGRSEYEGVGMGLAICKKIVERHGGEITAKSTPGKGSTLIIDLPVKQTRAE
jgi:PAS domain S-box-containing protein